MSDKNLNHIVEQGRAYCKQWLNLTPETLPDMSQDINPYNRGAHPKEFISWELGFWDELRRYVIGIMQPRN